MDKKNWLQEQVTEAKKEVKTWPEWKKSSAIFEGEGRESGFDESLPSGIKNRKK